MTAVGRGDCSVAARAQDKIRRVGDAPRHGEGTKPGHERIIAVREPVCAGDLGVRSRGTRKARASRSGTLVPLRSFEEKELATEDLTLSLGPAHPAVYGPLRLVLTLDGEQVAAAEADPGYAHRGLEKLAEGATGAWLTAEAKASLARLGKQSTRPEN